MPRASRGKHWCFTINNPSDAEIIKLHEIGQAQTTQYLVIGSETGENGTRHIQGYVAFTTRNTFASVKRLISPRVHLEIAKGTPKQNQAYCTKDGDYAEYGTLPGGQGTRTDLEEVAAKIKEGKSFSEITQEHPSAVLRYGGGVQRLINLVRPKSTFEPPQLWCFWGNTGTGKTRRVWQFANPAELYVHPGGAWFDGYDRQRAVLFDDFDGGWFKITYLLKLIDRYQPMSVPVKGSYTWWVPRTIYFTSNHHPRDWYKGASQQHQDALLRRFNEFGSIQECK